MPDHRTITPPPELRAKWMTEARSQDYCSITEQVAYRSAQWGYEQRGEVNEAKLQKVRDQELEACCKWLDYNCPSVGAHHLRNDRRPKPPSLKKEACDALDAYIYGNPDHNDKQNTYNTIRRALEALPDD